MRVGPFEGFEGRLWFRHLVVLLVLFVRVSRGLLPRGCQQFAKGDIDAFGHQLHVRHEAWIADEIEIQKQEDKPELQAIMDASVSRLRPVAMAASTTALGMIPLIFDAFFVSMAVTIIFGLIFATILTMIVLPVLYAILYRVPNAPSIRPHGSRTPLQRELQPEPAET